MKNHIFLYATVIFSLVACNLEEPENSSHKSNIFENILYTEKSPYIDWLLSDKEAFVSYTTRMYPTNINGEQSENIRGAEDNTITLKDGLKIHLHDDYSLKYGVEETTLYLSRTATILQEPNSKSHRIHGATEEAVSSLNHTYEYAIQTATPIQLIRPEINTCIQIPMCFHENFEVEWDADVTNENGVIIVAEWNGCSMYEPAQDVSVANVDIVEDSGLAVLDPMLFEGMPNEALVNLWLIRGNFITIEGEGEISLKEALENSPEVIEDLLATQSNLLLELQPFILGSGAITSFSFFLIKEL